MVSGMAHLSLQNTSCALMFEPLSQSLSLLRVEGFNKLRPRLKSLRFRVLGSPSRFVGHLIRLRSVRVFRLRMLESLEI